MVRETHDETYAEQDPGDEGVRACGAPLQSWRLVHLLLWVCSRRQRRPIIGGLHRITALLLDSGLLRLCRMLLVGSRLLLCRVLHIGRVLVYGVVRLRVVGGRHGTCGSGGGRSHIIGCTMQRQTDLQ